MIEVGQLLYILVVVIFISYNNYNHNVYTYNLIHVTCSCLQNSCLKYTRHENYRGPGEHSAKEIKYRSDRTGIRNLI